jgi:hypothetical protein
MAEPKVQKLESLRLSVEWCPIPRAHPPTTSPQTRRSLPVVPPSRVQRYYGEAQVGRRWYERAGGDAIPASFLTFENPEARLQATIASGKGLGRPAGVRGRVRCVCLPVPKSLRFPDHLAVHLTGVRHQAGSQVADALAVIIRRLRGIPALIFRRSLVRRGLALRDNLVFHFLDIIGGVFLLHELLVVADEGGVISGGCNLQFTGQGQGGHGLLVCG